MMRKLNRRGGAAFELCLIFVPLFTLVFVIFDQGRYTIYDAVLADAGECRRPGGHDQLLHA